MTNDDVINDFFGKSAAHPADFRCGYVAIVGRPNVGKSTLLNHILGQKLSITSRKPQTTRHRILGIVTKDNAQTVYVDTPGIHGEERKALNRYMNRAAYSALRDVDLVLFVVDGLKWTADDELVVDFTDLERVEPHVATALSHSLRRDGPSPSLVVVSGGASAPAGLVRRRLGDATCVVSTLHEAAALVADRCDVGVGAG